METLDGFGGPIVREFAKIVSRLIAAGKLTGLAESPSPELITPDAMWEFLAFNYVNHFLPGNKIEFTPPPNRAKGAPVVTLVQTTAPETREVYYHRACAAMCELADWLEKAKHVEFVQHLRDMADQLERYVSDHHADAPSPADPTSPWLAPDEAMAWLKLGDATQPERRRKFDKLRRALAQSERKTEGRVELVNIDAWRRVCAAVKDSAAYKDNWSDAIDDIT